MMKYCIYITTVVMMLISYVYADSLRVVANPCQRSMATMLTDTLNQRLMLFGGQDYGLTGEYYNDIWIYDCAGDHWRPISLSGPVPVKRRNPALAYRCLSNTQNTMYMFGGRMSSTFYNDLWLCDLQEGMEQWIQVNPSGTPPSPRTEVAGIYDPISDRFILFGGDAGGSRVNETWEYDINTNAWNQLFPQGTIPSPRSAYGAVYDHVGHRVIFFSGAASPIVNDVWSLDLSHGSEGWQQLYPSGPQPQGRGQLFYTYDSENRRMIVGFGFDWPGYILCLSDAWSLDIDSLTWRCILAPGLVYPRRGTCSAYNPSNGEIVVFGGDNGAPMANTYSLSTGALAIFENEKRFIKDSYPIEVLSNPTSMPVQIRLNLSKSCHATLKIYDISGRKITCLIDDLRGSGTYLENWSGCDHKGVKVPGGTYFMQLTIDGETFFKKAVIIE